MRLLFSAIIVLSGCAAAGPMHVTSSIPGVGVRVNGADVGVTPVTVDVKLPAEVVVQNQPKITTSVDGMTLTIFCDGQPAQTIDLKQFLERPPRNEAEDCRNPKFAMEFRSIAAQDRKAIQDVFASGGDPNKLENFTVNYELTSLGPQFSIEDFFDKVRADHRKACAVQSPSGGGQIVQNTGISLVLTYGSSNAQATGAFMVTLRVEPADAELRIDVAPKVIPALDGARAGGPANAVRTKEGQFTMRVPNVYAFDRRYIYFTTTTKTGTTWYYEYDCRLNRQQRVAGIGTRKSPEEDWAWYRDHRELPAK